MSSSSAPAALAADFSLNLCKQVTAWRYEDLPAPVVRMVKMCLADTLGVISGAARADGIPALHARMARWVAVAVPRP